MSFHRFLLVVESSDLSQASYNSVFFPKLSHFQQSSTSNHLQTFFRLCFAWCIIDNKRKGNNAKRCLEIKDAYSFGILLSKCFRPTVKKKCSSEREKLSEFKAEGREFATFLRSLEKCIQKVKGQNNFGNRMSFLTFSWRFFISYRLQNNYD